MISRKEYYDVEAYTKLYLLLSSREFSYLAKLFSVALFLFFTQLTIVNAQNILAEELYKSENFTFSNSFTHVVEGPAVDKYGIVYAVNFEHEGIIGKVTSSGEAGVSIELPKGSGGKGIWFDSHGNMLITDYAMHNILRADIANKNVSVFAHEVKITQPNEITIDSNGHIYVSNPDFKANKGRV